MQTDFTNDGAMDSEARERLIRLETLQAETNRRMDQLIALAETMARMQERERARDAQITAVTERIDAQAIEVDKLKRGKFWLAGAMAVITMIVLPSLGWVLKDTYSLILTVDHRLVRVEAQVGGLDRNKR